GAQAITAGPDVFEAGFAMPSIQKAVDDFGKDWEAIHHRKSI
ncbi:fructose-6-phosphate aldolase, partial [Streptococcus pyogenes]